MEINKGNSNKETFLKKSLKILKKTYLVGWSLFISIFFFSLFSYITANGSYDKYKNLTSSELVGHLMSEISTMDSRFSTAITWLFSIMTISIAFIGFYSYQQLKLSQNQIDQIRKDFGIEDINKKIEELNDFIDEANKALDDQQKSFDESLRKQQHSFNNALSEQKNDYFMTSLEIVSSNVENVTSSSDPFTISNDILNVIRVLKNIESENNNEIYKNKMFNSVLSFANGLANIKKYKTMNKNFPKYDKFLYKLNEALDLFQTIPKDSNDSEINNRYNEVSESIKEIIDGFLDNDN
ncbi:hypothetical protein M3M38_02145 [Fructilactobacillus cliffordii]|uniref:coiled-coil domain-containing protein n=1 Tax=Fructilactobacillus cliffordii TaxID=2940299 RepID=UPI002092FE85|nr:hypothetical protein [Fructilactobacillus cliffordii]USS86885.1 hypothetical protein M3M38_02145 [Fructilactobacillus cliffordii]